MKAVVVVGDVADDGAGGTDLLLLLLGEDLLVLLRGDLGLVLNLRADADAVGVFFPSFLSPPRRREQLVVGVVNLRREVSGAGGRWRG